MRKSKNKMSDYKWMQKWSRHFEIRARCINSFKFRKLISSFMFVFFLNHQNLDASFHVAKISYWSQNDLYHSVHWGIGPPGVFQIALRGGGDWKFYWGKFFYWVKGTWSGMILMIRTFCKAKNSFLWMLNIN